ncbi:MAG: chorismate-binding protein, partial [Campylobacterales bacterium]
QLSPLSLLSILDPLLPEEPLFLLESGVQNENGNYTFIAIGAQEEILFENGVVTHRKKGEEKKIAGGLIEYLQTLYSQLDQREYRRRGEELGISFPDGFIGYIGFEIVPYFEPVLTPHFQRLDRQIQIPVARLTRPRLLLIYSHRTSQLQIISNDRESDQLIPEIKRLLTSPYTLIPLKGAQLEGTPYFQFNREQFYEIVEAGKGHIRRGDIFQIVLSNRLIVPGEVEKLSFYRLLRSKNPSPYLFYLDFRDFALIGSSPEIMAKLEEGEILVRPIAGTRKRGGTLKRDLELEEELKRDKKEQAEHIMLVDLGRNDVGRVAKGGSVKVSELMRVERYSHVMHLVSDVVGELREGLDQFDLFRATFPAGTVSGAPKIKAMELIARYEGVERSFYSGAVGYFSFTGDMDTAIAIRTALWEPERMVFQAGAGIVADSKPELEFKEVNNKLGALVATLEELEGLN